MASIIRKIKRNKQRKEIFSKYGKRAKHSCPKCGKLTLFQRKGEDIICVQCKEVLNK